MSIQTEIDRLNSAKTNIKNAIETKGIEIPEDTKINEYDTYINNIKIDSIKTCRFVIGTSSNGWTEKDCDYLCDGVDDQIEINAAIQALPETGGEIKVLDGTYNITASILIDKERVTFCGCGQSTIFKRMWRGPSVSDAVIKFSKSYCTFKNFEIDGNKSVYTGGSGISSNYENITDILVECIFSNNNEGTSIFLPSVQNSIVTRNTCNNNTGSGIYLVPTQNSTILGNICNNNEAAGIYIKEAENITVSGNTCSNNNGFGIYLGSSQSGTVTGNTCNNTMHGIFLSTTENSTVTGNTCNNCSSMGIYIKGTENSTVTGNTCNNNNKGIYLTTAENSTVTGNTCIRGDGISSDYGEYQDTISTYVSNNCVIVANNCAGKAPTIGGTGNIVENNKY